MQERENGCLCVRLSAEIGRRTGFLCFIILKSASFSGFGAEFFRQCVFWLPVWKSLSKISRGSVWPEYRKRSFSLYFFAERMYDNEAERPGNGYTALEGRPSGRVFANASGILPESHCFCQLNRPPAEMADEQRKAVGNTTFDDLVTGKRDSQWTVTERWRRARSVLKTWPGRHIGLKCGFSQTGKDSGRKCGYCP